MQLITAEKVNTHARRQSEYRQRHPERARRSRANADRKRRAAAFEFIGVDTEGIGKGARHRVVLLGVGTESYLAKDFDRGLQWDEICEFLYAQFRQHPTAAFVGFYLGYDFENWFSTKCGFPLSAARMLWTKEGKATRKVKHNLPGTKFHRQTFPVRIGGWEIDMLGKKRLSIRPRADGCLCFENKESCTHEPNPWMHICDTGPYFQTSFKSLITPKMWEKDPEGPICTPDEYDIIVHGKDKLRGISGWDERLIEYNTVENIVLARVMTRLDKSIQSVGLKLSKDQWYGPGALASKWLTVNKIPKREDLKNLQPKWFREACRKSYYGGWFEIMSHGIIYGETFNYDINNAYPYATSKLPHICSECGYRRGKGDYNGTSKYVLLYCTVFTKGTRIGAVPHREKDGTILRPGVSKGWYWSFEIESARRAGLVKSVRFVNEWVEFTPCSHPSPFLAIRDLYYLRLKKGKASALGIAIKTLNNSLYGKCAQSVGTAPYNNWFYASFITAHCRAQILDSIATHPGKADSVLMVATDGICFDSPHPSLAISYELGEWEEKTYYDLLLIKPGMYGHKDGKENLKSIVKSRGVPRDEFEKGIQLVEDIFAEMQRYGMYPGAVINPFYYDEETGSEINLCWAWPAFPITISFRMKTCLQAIREGKWETSAAVQEKVTVKQDSDPSNKRRSPHWNDEKRRIDTYYREVSVKNIQTTYHKEAIIPKPVSLGEGYEGGAVSPILELAGILREKPANYGIDIGEIEWERIW